MLCSLYSLQFPLPKELSPRLDIRHLRLMSCSGSMFYGSRDSEEANGMSEGGTGEERRGRTGDELAGVSLSGSL